MKAPHKNTSKDLQIAENRDEIADILKDEGFFVLDTQGISILDYAKLEFFKNNYSKISIEDLENLKNKLN